MNAAAAAAADFKNGFGSQFNGLMQPFTDTDALYSSYSSYNNWAAKVPSPLGAKTFPWSVNPLTSVVPANHQPAVGMYYVRISFIRMTIFFHYFDWVFSNQGMNCFNAASTVSGMGSSSMLGGGMSSGTTSGGGGCPYGPPATPYTMYHRGTDLPNHAMSSSIASLRLKAKQHVTSSFAYSPVTSRPGSAGLSACQYATIDRNV